MNVSSTTDIRRTPTFAVLQLELYIHEANGSYMYLIYLLYVSYLSFVHIRILSIYCIYISGYVIFSVLQLTFGVLQLLTFGVLQLELYMRQANVLYMYLTYLLFIRLRDIQRTAIGA